MKVKDLRKIIREEARKILKESIAMNYEDFINKVLQGINNAGVDAFLEDDGAEPERGIYGHIVMHLEGQEDFETVEEDDIRITTALKVLRSLGAKMENKADHGMPGGYSAVNGTYNDLHIEISWVDPEAGIGIYFEKWS